MNKADAVFVALTLCFIAVGFVADSWLLPLGYVFGAASQWALHKSNAINFSRLVGVVETQQPSDGGKA